MPLPPIDYTLLRERLQRENVAPKEAMNAFSQGLSMGLQTKRDNFNEMRSMADLAMRKDQLEFQKENALAGRELQWAAHNLNKENALAGRDLQWAAHNLNKDLFELKKQEAALNIEQAQSEVQQQTKDAEVMRMIGDKLATTPPEQLFSDEGIRGLTQLKSLLSPKRQEQVNSLVEFRQLSDDAQKIRMQQLQTAKNKAALSAFFDNQETNARQELALDGVYPPMQGASEADVAYYNSQVRDKMNQLGKQAAEFRKTITNVQPGAYEATYDPMTGKPLTVRSKPGASVNAGPIAKKLQTDYQTLLTKRDGYMAVLNSLKDVPKDQVSETLKQAAERNPSLAAFFGGSLPDSKQKIEQKLDEVNGQIKSVQIRMNKMGAAPVVSSSEEKKSEVSVKETNQISIPRLTGAEYVSPTLREFLEGPVSKAKSETVFKINE